MLETILAYGAVFVGSMFKFIFGPVFGEGADLTIIETAIFTVLGMMATVVIISVIGEKARKSMIWGWRKDRRLFTKRNRMIVKLWSRFGIAGVAFCTPLFLMPMGGAIIAVSFGVSRAKIIKYMLVSAIFWAVLDTIAVAYFGDLLRSIGLL